MVGITIGVVVASKEYHDRQLYEGEYYVTMHGEKYHLENCVTIQEHETRRLTKEDVESGKYEPCSVCLPEKNKGMIGMKKIKTVSWVISCIIFLFSVVLLNTTVYAESDTYKLYVDVSWKENLIFDKYDVKLLIDGNEIGTIEYANPYTYLADVKKGKHTITFSKETDADIQIEETISITESMTYRCKIQTEGKKVNIVSSELEATLEGSSIEMPDVMLMYVSKATEQLEAAGFKNTACENSDGKSAKKDCTWIVVDQSEEKGTSLDKNDRIVLTCEKTSDFLTEHFIGKNVIESIEEAKRVGYEVSFINPIMDTDMRNYLNGCDEEELKNWSVSECSFIESEQKVAELEMVYGSERTLPNVIGMSLKHAISELKAAGFEKLSFQSEEGKSISESAGHKWKVTGQSVKAGSSIAVDEELTLTCIAYDKLTKTELFVLEIIPSDTDVSEVKASVEEDTSENKTETEAEAAVSEPEENSESKASVEESNNETEMESEIETEAEIVDDGLDILNILGTQDD